MVDADGRAQIIDFGLSKFESMSGFTTAQLGDRNPRYCAPELLRQAKEEGVIKPTFESDVFGFSMTMLEVRAFPILALVDIANINIDARRQGSAFNPIQPPPFQI
jgi:serine/threonine protein kinase